jgi:formylmethanofuran dehydrogenase subunit D
LYYLLYVDLQKVSPKVEYRSIVGNASFTVGIPKKYSQNLGLQKGDHVRITEENGKIIIEKAE